MTMKVPPYASSLGKFSNASKVEPKRAFSRKILEALYKATRKFSQTKKML